MGAVGNIRQLLFYAKVLRVLDVIKEAVVAIESNEMTPSRTWRFGVAAAVSAAFFALDQLTKMFVRANLPLNTSAGEIIPGVLRLLHVQNVGAAFSLGEGMGSAFVLLAVAVVAATVWYLWKTPMLSRVETVGLAMVAGGAVGNALDRLLFGYVTDFFACEFIDFPVFNVADIGITVGVVVAFIGFMFLSPANKVDATVELNRRDAERRARRDARKGGRKGGCD